MNTTLHSTLSAATGLGLVSFVATTALVSGIAAPAAVAGIGLLAVYGAVEIAVASYAGPRFVRRPFVPPAVARPVAREAAILVFPNPAQAALDRAA